MTTAPTVAVGVRLPEPLVVKLDRLVYARQVEAGSRRRATRSEVIRDLLTNAVTTSPVRSRNPLRA
jgi:Arc/MetJ-type ribon-helix-helix transcriptional regulator